MCAHELELPGSELAGLETFRLDPIPLDERVVGSAVAVSPVGIARHCGANLLGDVRCDESRVGRILRSEEDVLTDLRRDGRLGVREVGEPERSDCGAVGVFVDQSTPGEGAKGRAVGV